MTPHARPLVYMIHLWNVFIFMSVNIFHYDFGCCETKWWALKEYFLFGSSFTATKPLIKSSNSPAVTFGCKTSSIMTGHFFFFSFLFILVCYWSSAVLVLRVKTPFIPQSNQTQSRRPASRARFIPASIFYNATVKLYLKNVNREGPFSVGQRTMITCYHHPTYPSFQFYY